MAKTLLGLVASPRKFGNSELFIKELYLQLPGNWELQLIRLPDMDIRPCKACYQCLFGEEKCPQDDDFALVLETLSQSDAYVVAAPTYLLGANASLKRFLDRGLSFYARIDRLWGKPAVGVAIAGIDGMEGYTKLNVESFIKLAMERSERLCRGIWRPSGGDIFAAGRKRDGQAAGGGATPWPGKGASPGARLSGLRRRHLSVSPRRPGALHVVQQFRRLCLEGRPAANGDAAGQTCPLPWP